MERELPIYKDPDSGIEFIVDVGKLEVRLKSDPEKTYSISDMRDFGDDGYDFDHYDKERKNSLRIDLPQFVALDPLGMAEKYNKSPEEIKSMSDFEVIIDQELLTKRLKYGHIPTIEIEGHIFFAEARLDLLRPKDDYSTMGIRFDDLEDWYVDDKDTYAFPYDPKTREIGEIEWDKIVEYPKDLLFVEIPFVRILDPVGWNRRWGWDETEGLKETGLKLEFKAETIPWHKAGIDELIAENKLKNIPKEDVKEEKAQQKKRQGPKL